MNGEKIILKGLFVHIFPGYFDDGQVQAISYSHFEPGFLVVVIVNVADGTEYFCLCLVNNERIKYRKKDKFASRIFLVVKKDLFTTITIKWKPGFRSDL